MSPVSLTSTWFLAPGREAEAISALEALAEAVRAGEPDTLMYLVHTPYSDMLPRCRPPISPQQVLFFEMYRSPAAFDAHVEGPIFQGFLREHGGLFVGDKGPYTTVRFLERRAGFIRDGAVSAASSSPEALPEEP